MLNYLTQHIVRRRVDIIGTLIAVALFAFACGHVCRGMF